MSDLLAETLNDPAVGAVGTAVVFAGIALWLAAAWWAYADAARRAESSLAGFVAAGWIILSTPLLLPLSLAAYAFARPQVAAADRRTRALALELAMTPARPACPACAESIEEAWLRCPTCATWLAAPCAHCGAWSDASLEICPMCGNDAREHPYVEGPATVDAGAIAAIRGRRRRVPWRATAPGIAAAQQPEGRRLPQRPSPARATISRAH
ncbi:MAG TPA: hypothetical protein VFP56_00435 [Candidatus Limnocylindrales bacterium]|nr:hypothetical protein [Candidatus Limnocylindrales bacterium]